MLRRKKRCAARRVATLCGKCTRAILAFPLDQASSLPQVRSKTQSNHLPQGDCIASCLDLDAQACRSCDRIAWARGEGLSRNLDVIITAIGVSVCTTTSIAVRSTFPFSKCLGRGGRRSGKACRGMPICVLSEALDGAKLPQEEERQRQECKLGLVVVVVQVEKTRKHEKNTTFVQQTSTYT